MGTAVAARRSGLSERYTLPITNSQSTNGVSVKTCRLPFLHGGKRSAKITTALCITSPLLPPFTKESVHVHSRAANGPKITASTNRWIASGLCIDEVV